MRGGTEPTWRARSTLWTASNSAATPPGLVRTYGRPGGVELYPQAGTRCVVRATGKLHFELADTSDSTNVVKDDSRPRAPQHRARRMPSTPRINDIRIVREPSAALAGGGQCRPRGAA